MTRETLIRAIEGLLEISALKEDAIEPEDRMLVENARVVLNQAKGEKEPSPERMRLRDAHEIVGPVVERTDSYISIEHETTEIVTRAPQAFEAAPPALETPRMLVLSTSHITKQTDSNLEWQTDDVPGTFYPKVAGLNGEQYGWLIPCGPSNVWSHMISADLIAIRQLAEAAGATWIMLDRDGPRVDQLPTYEW